MSITGKLIVNIVAVDAPIWLTVTLPAQKSALRMISAKGGSVPFTRSIPGGYNPATGDAFSSETTWYTPAVIDTYSRKEIDGSMIQQNDFKLLIPGVAPRPLSGDSVVVAGVTVWVVSVEAVAPAGVPILFTVQCRK